MAGASDFAFLSAQYQQLDKDFQTLAGILKTALSTIREQRAEKQLLVEQLHSLAKAKHIHLQASGAAFHSGGAAQGKETAPSLVAALQSSGDGNAVVQAVLSAATAMPETLPSVFVDTLPLQLRQSLVEASAAPTAALLRGTKRSREAGTQGPEPPPPAFLFFLKATRPKLMEERPDLSAAERDIAAAEQWRDMPHQARAPFLAQYARARATFLAAAGGSPPKKARQAVENPVESEAVTSTPLGVAQQSVQAPDTAVQTKDAAPAPASGVVHPPTPQE